MATAPFPDFVHYCTELLSGIGRVSAHRMFGGYGLKCDAVNVAIIIEDVLYLKTDDELREQFARAGGAPFRYDKRGGEVTVTSYFTVPPEAMESPGEMTHWARLALTAARRAALKKKPAKKAMQSASRATPKAAAQVATTDAGVRSAVKKVAAKKAPVKKTPAKKAAVKKTGARNASVKKISGQSA